MGRLDVSRICIILMEDIATLHSAWLKCLECPPSYSEGFFFAGHDQLPSVLIEGMNAERNSKAHPVSSLHRRVPFFFVGKQLNSQPHAAACRCGFAQRGGVGPGRAQVLDWIPFKEDKMRPGQLGMGGWCSLVHHPALPLRSPTPVGWA